MPLGPAPLASNAGTGQDYRQVAGCANAVVIDRADPTGNTVYAGGAFGGQWRSTNAANSSVSAVTWTPLTDNQPTLSFGAIAFQPGNATNNLSNVIIAGTGEANAAIDSYYGPGFLRSADAENAWTLISTSNGGALSPKGLAVARMAFSTANAKTVVAAITVFTARNRERSPPRSVSTHPQMPGRRGLMRARLTAAQPLPRTPRLLCCSMP